MSGKGSKQRKRQVDRKQFISNWNKTFNTKLLEEIALFGHANVVVNEHGVILMPHKVNCCDDDEEN